MEENPWKTLGSKQIYTNPWITIREDQVLKPNGEPGIYGVVDTRIATGAVALNERNEIYLVGQYRYPTCMYSWEIPEGGSDPQESALDTIKRELQEEAGIIAQSWTQLGGEVHLSNCFSSERAYLYLARDLSETNTAHEDTEVLKVKKVPFAEALRMVDSGEIVDAMSVIGILRAQRMLSL